MMNEIFNRQRFWSLTTAYYAENKKIIWIFIGVMVLITFLCLTQFDPFRPVYSYIPNYGEKMRFIRHRHEIYVFVFVGLLFFYSIVAAAYSFRHFMSREKGTRHFLLPASLFEKYLLVFLVSTIVVFLIHLIIFYSLAEIVSTYKFVGMKIMSFREVDWLSFRFQLPFFQKGQEIVRPDVGNIFQGIFMSRTQITESGYVFDLIKFNAFWAGWLLSIGIFMWGALTFRKHSFFLTLLFHALLWLVIISIGAYIAYEYVGNLGAQMGVGGLQIYAGGVEGYSAKWYSLLLYMLPVGYFWIVWKKLKEKQVY